MGKNLSNVEQHNLIGSSHTFSLHTEAPSQSQSTQIADIFSCNRPFMHVSEKQTKTDISLLQRQMYVQEEMSEMI